MLGGGVDEANAGLTTANNCNNILFSEQNTACFDAEFDNVGQNYLIFTSNSAIELERLKQDGQSAGDFLCACQLSKRPQLICTETSFSASSLFQRHPSGLLGQITRRGLSGEDFVDSSQSSYSATPIDCAEVPGPCPCSSSEFCSNNICRPLNGQISCTSNNDCTFNEFCNFARDDRNGIGICQSTGDGGGG